AELEAQSPAFKGSLYALKGNLRALSEKQRFIDSDLNRMWRMKPNMVDLQEVPNVYERKEMTALHEMVMEIIDQRDGPIVFLDLHTTSSESPPFILIGDTLRNRKFVSGFPVPKVLGLEEQLNGPFLSYLNVLGHISIGFEAGQHDAEISVDNHYALLWMILEKAGCMKAEDIPKLKAHYDFLSQQSPAGLKNFFEVRYRHGIEPSHQFRMKPGYDNFQKVEKGETLAENKGGPVNSNWDGRVFMPLYQSQGDDGFFIIRRIPKFSLVVSKMMRTLKLHKVLPWFPGIQKHPEHEGSIIVRPNALRRFGPGLLNLFGYRRRARTGETFHYIKRGFDLHGPAPIDEFPK
ncbi:MAG: succinylglutamate desuccinylase/aspartoacylase family protein, partial [Bacteroidota bacterium]